VWRSLDAVWSDVVLEVVIASHREVYRNEWAEASTIIRVIGTILVAVQNHGKAPDNTDLHLAESTGSDSSGSCQVSWLRFENALPGAMVY
jgi:hypothetical protein